MTASVVTGILRTIKAAMVHRRLGSVRARELTTIDRTLRETLGLDKNG